MILPVESILNNILSLDYGHEIGINGYIVVKKHDGYYFCYKDDIFLIATLNPERLAKRINENNYQPTKK